MTEVLTYIKLIKMYAWERSFAKAVSSMYIVRAFKFFRLSFSP